MKQYFFIQFNGTTSSWSHKFSCMSTMAPEMGFTAYRGCKISGSEGELIRRGYYSIKEVTESEFLAEQRDTF